MASYPTVLPAQPQTGFFAGLGKGIGQGASAGSNAYIEALFKDTASKKKEKEAQEKIDKYSEAMKLGGYDIDTSTIDAEGKTKHTYKKRETPEEKYLKDPAKAIKQAMAGITDPESLGGVLNIPQQTPLPQQAAADFFPAASMIGQTPDISGAPVNYGEHVKKSLMADYAPGLSKEQMTRNVLGFPEPKAPTQEIPPEFTQDIEIIKDIAQTDSQTFIKGLQRIIPKYADNPVVLDRITKMMNALKYEKPEEKENKSWW